VPTFFSDGKSKSSAEPMIETAFYIHSTGFHLSGPLFAGGKGGRRSTSNISAPIIKTQYQDLFIKASTMKHSLLHNVEPWRK
jgi:hypothetical protein